MDGISLLPLLQGELPASSPRTKGIGFHLNAQEAWQQDFGKEGIWKIIHKPNKGQCETFFEPYASLSGKELNGPFLFNLSEDPTETKDLCSQHQDRCDSMLEAMKSFRDSLDYSAVHESKCMPLDSVVV